MHIKFKIVCPNKPGIKHKTMSKKSYKKLVALNQKINRQQINEAIRKSAINGDCFTPAQNKNKS